MFLLYVVLCCFFVLLFCLSLKNSMSCLLSEFYSFVDVVSWRIFFVLTNFVIVNEQWIDSAFRITCILVFFLLFCWINYLSINITIPYPCLSCFIYKHTHLACYCFGYFGLANSMCTSDKLIAENTNLWWQNMLVQCTSVHICFFHNGE